MEWSLRTSASLHNRETSDAVIVSGSPRGGTTWLAEIVRAGKHRRIVWEPLIPENNHHLHKVGGYRDIYLPPADPAPRWKAHFDKIIRGRSIAAPLLGPIPHTVREAFFERKLLFKFTRANLLLPWVNHHYPETQAVVIIRHPCAVVASQLHFGAWDHMQESVEQGKLRRRIREGVWRWPSSFKEKYPRFHDSYCSITSVEEFLAFEWLLETAVPLYETSSSTHLVTYEDLVTQGEEEVDRLFKHLEAASASPEALSRLDRPSATTEAGSNVAQGKDPLLTWKRRLSSEQIDLILNLVHRSGIDFYTREVTPREDRLASWKERFSPAA